MAATALQVYEAVKPKLGEREAQLLLDHIAAQSHVSTAELATKVELERLGAEMREEFGKVRADMQRGFGELRTEMVKENGKLRTDMEKIRSDLIKWMFLFWTGQFGAMVALFRYFRS
jgi:hypothetical protein